MDPKITDVIVVIFWGKSVGGPSDDFTLAVTPVIIELSIKIDRVVSGSRVLITEPETIYVMVDAFWKGSRDGVGRETDSLLSAVVLTLATAPMSLDSEGELNCGGFEGGPDTVPTSLVIEPERM